MILAVAMWDFVVAGGTTMMDPGRTRAALERQRIGHDITADHPDRPAWETKRRPYTSSDFIGPRQPLAPLSLTGYALSC